MTNSFITFYFIFNMFIILNINDLTFILSKTKLFLNYLYLRVSISIKISLNLELWKKQKYNI